MKKIYSLKNLIFFSFLLCIGKLEAQVMIGAETAPKTHSVLELFSEYKTGVFGGLRMPQLTTAQRDALNVQALTDNSAYGLMIYNLDNNCMEYWNSMVWVSLCDKLCPPAPSFTTAPTTVCSGATNVVYAVTQVTGVSYTWTLPSDWTQTAGSNTHSIEVTVGSTGGVITVTPSANGCTGTTLTSSTITVNNFTQDNPSNQITCTGSFNFGMAAASGPGTITYSWEQSDDHATWTTVSGATTANPTLTVTKNTYFRRIATSSDCGTNITSAYALVTFDRPSLPTFMAYNLGADPALNTPALQMAYLADNANGIPITFTSHGRVFGGRYQWGRQNLPYAISTDGTYTLYNVTNAAELTASATYDPITGQILTYNGSTSASNYHVYNNSITMDWRGTGAATVPCTDGNQCNLLWGNGETINTPTPGTGAVLHTDGNYYQKPVKTVNDPCPSGYRLPTQNDWELIGNYDCNPTIADGRFIVPSSGIYQASNGLTWVKISCSDNECHICTTAWAPLIHRTGYAVYNTSEWNAAGYDLTTDLTNASTQPILFLPAAGYRLAGSSDVNTPGFGGYYWSSTIRSDYGTAYYLSFNNTQVVVSDHNFRAQGFSVRCVAE